MICELCLEESDLLDSHIIPEFMYKYLYDEKHRFYEVTSNESIETEFRQKGLREKLLCLKCEGILNKYETYASKVFFTRKLEFKQKGLLILFNNIDYVKFKLFALSILWRASVSKHPFFERVNLGKQHSEKLRQMLLLSNPGAVTDYGFIIFNAKDSQELTKQLLVPPQIIRIENHRTYRFLLFGMFWIFFVSNHTIDHRYKDLFLKENNHLTIIKNDPKTVDRFIQNLVRDFL